MQQLQVNQEVDTTTDFLEKMRQKAQAFLPNRKQAPSESASPTPDGSGTSEGAKRSRIPDLAFIAVFLGGMLVFFYPAISNYWNTLLLGCGRSL